VAGFTLRYGTLSSFAVRLTVDHHTASRGMRHQIGRVASSRNEIFQQLNSVIVAINRSLINYILLVSESVRAHTLSRPHDHYQKHVIATT
jgi:hypothetical protein